MKKNMIFRVAAAAILLLACVFAVAAAAAEYVADDGMSFEIITTKQEYGTDEEVKIILLAKNYNQNMKQANIAWNATVPGGELTFLAGDLSGTQTVEVGERAAINLRLMKITEKPEAQEPPVTEPVPTEPVQPAVPKGADPVSIIVLIVLIVIALAAIGIVVYLVLKRRSVISCIALLLALGMLLPCMPVMDVSAAAENVGDMIMGEDDVLTGSVKFVVDGVEYESTATITYEMEKQTETRVEAMHPSMSDLEWEEYPAPLVTPTIGQHPRLMFTEADIPRIIKNLEAEENVELRNEFYRLLGVTFNGSFGAPTITTDEDGNEIINTNFSSDKLNSIRIKALYYALFKNSDDPEKAHMAEYYGKTAVRAIQKAMETIRFKDGFDVDTRGIFQMAASEVYDWCYDLLTYADKQNIAAMIQDIAAASEPGWPIHPGPAVVSHLAGNSIQTWWMAIGIAMYDEYPTIYECIAGMYFDVFVAPRNAWYVSETHHQGASYGVPGRYDADIQAQALLFTMTGGFNDLNGDGEADGYLSLDPLAGRAAYQMLYSLRPDGQYLREGDTWEENQTSKNEIWDSGAANAYKVSSIYKDGKLKRLAYEFNNLSLGHTHLIQALLWGDPDLEAESYSDLPYTKYFASPSGSMIARTGWNMGTESNDVLVKMQLSQAYVDNHQHRDAGAFQIYYKGILASESGYYVIYNTPHDQYYNKSSIAHNTLSITSIQNRYGTQVHGYDTSWGHVGHTDLVTTVVGEEFGPNIYKPEYSYLAGDIAGTYDANVQEAVRSMLFLNLELDGNTENPGAFVVFDQIKTTEVGSKKSFLLHMQSEPEIEDNVIVVKNTAGDYNGKLTQQVMYVGTADQADENYTITKLGGVNQQFLVGQYNYAHTDAITSDLCQEQGWGRVEVTTTTKEANQTDYLLNVMYVGDADKEAETIPAKLIYDGKGVVMGVQLMGHVAMFNMDGNNRISDHVSFTIPKSADHNTFKVNVAGLKAGTWKVYVNGAAVDTQVASEEGGMIYFEATAGTVKLVYSNSNSNKTFDETHTVEEEPIGLLINNFYYYTEANPVLSGDDYLIPVSDVFEALNGKGQWNKEHSKYTVIYKTQTYEFTANSITKDGATVTFKEIRAVNGDLLLDMTTLKALILEDGVIYYDRIINRIRIEAEAQLGVPALSDRVLYEYPTAVQVDTLIDNGYSTMGMSNAVDDDPSTRWVSQKAGNNISEGVFDFGKIVPLTDILIMFYTESSLYSDYIIDIFVSKDGFEWTQAYEKARSGEVSPDFAEEGYAVFPMNDDARYVKIVGHGRYRYNNSGKPNPAPDNSWTSIAEIIFLQKSIIDPDGAPVTGNKLLAEAECFNMQNSVTVERNNVASGKEIVVIQSGRKNNPGKVSASTPHLSATFIPQKTGTHYIWARVNASKVTSGSNLWVNIEGMTGDSYYAENVNVGKKDEDGFVWIKLGQYETQVAMAKWEAGKEYTLSVISGCDKLMIDCFMVTAEASYSPYGASYSKQTSIEGELSVNAKHAIYEQSMAKVSGTGAKLQAVSADGSVSQKYLDYVLKNKNLPGDISLNIITDTSGKFSVWATVQADSLENDRFFYAVSANDADYYYKLGDLSEMTTVTDGEFVKVKLGEIEIQASESIYVRIKSCSTGVVIGTISTTCEEVSGVFKTTDGKTTIQAEHGKLAQAGDETVIIDNGAYYSGELANIVDSTGAVGGKAVKLIRGYSAWNQMITVNAEANPHFSVRVMPDESGEYYIWAKVYAPQGAGIYAWIDGGEDTYYWRQQLTMETYSVDAEDYIWVRLHEERRNGEKLTREYLYEWTARRVYTISLRAFTAGVKIDEIYVTNDPNDKPHNHSYSTTWSTDETHHWYAVDCGCEDAPTRFYGEHFYEDHADKYCNTCNYRNPNYEPHNYVDGKCTICGSLEPFKTTNGKLTLEAEDLMLALDGSENFIAGHTGSVIKVVNNDGASGGTAVEFTRTNPSWNQYLEVGTTPIPHLSAYITPDKSGQYYIWVKAYVPSIYTTTPGIYCYIDGGKDTYYWRQPLNLTGHSQAEGDYIWVRIDQEWRATALTSERYYEWTAGKTYQLRFRGFLSGVQIDQIYITTSANDRPHNHTYSESWTKDETHHWQEPTCDDTTLIANKAEHDYDNVTDQTCNTCGYVRPAHTHSYSSEWSGNATNHWYGCACGAQKDTEPHNFVSGVCSICGMSAPVSVGTGAVTIQAEDAKLDLEVDSTNKSATSTGKGSKPLQVISNSYAGGGKIVRTLGYYPAALYTTWANDLPGHIEITVTPEVTGTYHIWAKLLAPKSTTNVRVLIDGDTKNGSAAYAKQELSGPNSGSSDYNGAKLGECQDFIWVKFGGTYEWTEGEAYVIRIRSTSINVSFDEFVITADASYTPHRHTYSSEWSSDATHHWREPICTDITLVTDKAEHIYDDINDATCNTCGYIRPVHEHSFTIPGYDRLNHWFACSCGNQTDAEPHTIVSGVCTVCGLNTPILVGASAVTIQAEDAMLDLEVDSTNKSATSTGKGSKPLQVISNGYAGGGKIVRTLGYYPSALYTTWANDLPGHIEIAVTPETSGTYYIWAKLLAPKSSTNVRVLIDGDTKNGSAAYVRQELSGPSHGSSDYNGAKLGECQDFIWVRFTGKYEWTEGGAYVIRIRSTSINVSFDEFVITSDANYNPQ